MKRAVVLLAFATGVVPAVQAQEAPVDCTPGSMSEDYGGPLSPNGISLISAAGDHFVSDDVRDGAIGKWTGENGCAEDQLPPLFSAAVSNAELWTVKQGRYTDFPEISVSSNACGYAPPGTSRTIYLFDEPGCKKKWRQIEILAHELGHGMRLGHTTDTSQCSDRLMYPRITLDDSTLDKKNPHADDCAALKREVDRGGDGDDGGGGGGGGGGGDVPGRGDEVDCATEPWRPECRQAFSVCREECYEVPGGAVCDVVCTEYEFSPGATGGGATTQTGVGSLSYTIELSAEASVSVSLTGMDRDIDCQVGTSRCTNLGSTLDDSWNGTLAAGEHTLTVYPYGGGTGSYTLTVTAAYALARTLPFTVSETNVSGDREQEFTLESRTEVKVSLTGMSHDIDCKVNDSQCTNYGGTRDDSWTGTLDAGAHTVTVYRYGGGAGSYTLTVSEVGGTTTPTPDPAPTPTPPTATPLACPGIPDFTLPSGGAVHTVFGEASGGTPPYSYSLSGQPPGITFVASTRVASGTLPTPATDTTYRVTYTCRDQGGSTDSTIFSATVQAAASVPVPGTPASLSGTATQSVAGGAVSVAVSWSAGSGGAPASYQLDRRNGSAWISEGSHAGTSASTSVTPPAGVTVNTMTFRVAAANASGTSGFRQTTFDVEHDPPTPSSFSGSATQAGPGAHLVAQLQWSAGSGGAATSSCRVEQYQGSGYGWVFVGNFTTTSATVRQTNLPAGHVARTANFRIRSENALGESSWRQLGFDVSQTTSASQ